MLRVISEIRPKWIVAENVTHLIAIEKGMVFEQVCLDLENEGYEVQPFIIPACAVNAPHRRDRIWIIAYPRCEYGKRRSQKRNFTEQIKKKDAVEFERSITGNRNGIIANSTGQRLERGGKRTYERIRNLCKRCDTNAANSTEQGLEGKKPEGEFSGRKQGCSTECDWDKNWYEVAAEFCRVDARVSNRVDRLKALGNAIVPQVAYEILMVIREV